MKRIEEIKNEVAKEWYKNNKHDKYEELRKQIILNSKTKE